jgi:hypothetical protein
MKGIFETLPNNITSFKRKVKKISPLKITEYSNSPIQEEKEIGKEIILEKELKEEKENEKKKEDKENKNENENEEEEIEKNTNSFDISNNPRLAKIIKKFSINNNKLEEEPNKTNKISTFSNKNQEQENYKNLKIEEHNNIIYNERNKPPNSNLSETINLFKDKINERHKINTKTEDFNNYGNNTEKFFNVGHAENFSIFNSYESILNNSNPKGNNDFFADSNVSFRNSFLRNMKNKTDFKNMNLIKNSFSQSTINMQENFGNLTKSVKNLHRLSTGKIRKNPLKIIKSISIYNKTNHANILKNNYNNNDIFDIDEENLNDELKKRKTLNTKILTHLNKYELINENKGNEILEISDKKQSGKYNENTINNNFNSKFDMSIISSKKSRPNSSSKFDKQKLNENPTDYNRKQTYNNLILPNDSETEPKYTEKVTQDFYQSGKITEKGVGDFRIITDIDIKNKKNNDSCLNNTPETILSNEKNHYNFKELEKEKNIVTNKFLFNKIDSGTDTTEEKYIFKYDNIYLAEKRKNFFDILQKKMKVNYEKKRAKWDKIDKENNLQEDNYENSLFKTKSIKFSKRKNSLIKKFKKINSKSQINNNINTNFYNFIENDRNYNLSVLNNLEKRRNFVNRKGINNLNSNDFSYLNKNLVKSISNIYFQNQSKFI